MPAYSGNGTAELLNANRTMYFWENEIVPVATLPGSLRSCIPVREIAERSISVGLCGRVQFNGSGNV